METKRIAELLDKYYRGETTLEEERLLKTFFQQEDTPEELQADKDIFLLYTGLAQQPVDLPEGLKERLSASIGRWQQESQRRRPWLRPSIRLWSIGIAASLLIAAGMGIYLQKAEPKQHDTFTNPEFIFVLGTQENNDFEKSARIMKRDLEQQEDLNQATNRLLDKSGRHKATVTESDIMRTVSVISTRI